MLQANNDDQRRVMTKWDFFVEIIVWKKLEECVLCHRPNKKINMKKMSSRNISILILANQKKNTNIKNIIRYIYRGMSEDDQKILLFRQLIWRNGENTAILWHKKDDDKLMKTLADKITTHTHIHSTTFYRERWKRI